MQIPFSQTHFFSKLIIDYIEGKNDVVDFYSYRPSLDEIPRLIEDKKNENIDRNALVSILKKQYATCTNLHVSNANRQQIQALQDEQTFCIVTAHQLNIFGGPLYFIYKIAQTISTCNQLKSKFPQYHFVPIYWMGSEDHDFDEINHIQLFNNKIEWTDKQGGITGAYQPSSIAACIDELETILGSKPYTSELVPILRQAYAQPTLALATRYVVHTLFGDAGLVIVDGNDTALKAQFSKVMEDELLHQNSIQLVTKQIHALESKAISNRLFHVRLICFILAKIVESE
ncbi:MAG: bacillithiol biosynthesis BshC [Chitinophagales bacterium]